MVDNRHRKKAIREIMERDGVSYCIAMRRHDAELEARTIQRLENVPMPDINCYTLPDGSCVSDKPCMHNSHEELVKGTGMDPSAIQRLEDLPDVTGTLSFKDAE